MSYSISLEISPSVNEVEKEIIEKYWKYKNNRFSYKVGKLADQYDSSIYGVVQLVKKNSTCHLIIGKCLDCNQKLEFMVTSRAQFDSKLNHVRCDTHHQEYNLKISEELKERNISYDELIVEKTLTFQLEKLPSEHLEILAKIVQIDDRNEIFSKVFFGDSNRSNQEIWKIVNDLESKKFLTVERNQQGKVVAFNFLDQLKNMLTEYFDIKEIKQSLDNSVRTDLKPNSNKTKSSQPDLIGKIKLPEDFFFRKDIEYACGAWIRNDGSIYLKITPEGDFFRIGGQPKHIGDIMSDEFGFNTDEF